MQLIDVGVQRYRCIEDSGVVPIEPGVTCLVGKNESGKTAFLRALFRINPVDASAGFDEVVDYPSRLTRERKTTEGYLRAVQATFRLGDDEVAAIEEELGAGVLTSRTLLVERGYRETAARYCVEVDESVAVNRLRRGLDLPPEHSVSVGVATTLDDLLAALVALPEPSEEVVDLLGRIRGWRERRLSLHVIDTYLSNWQPRFVYFADYDSMPGKVAIPRRDSGTLGRGGRAGIARPAVDGRGQARGLPGRTPSRAADPRGGKRRQQHQRRGVPLLVAESRPRVELRVLQPEPGAVPPLDQGPLLQVRVRNDRHRVSIPFDERSRGFVWFFSFLAYFSQLEEEAQRNGGRELILLLDEPGLSLHATAQDDLLALIEDRLAHHQVIYTTHSPFLVDLQRLRRTRTVTDVDDAGTRVSADLSTADPETAFPLQAALGFELAGSLFVEPHTVLVEGPSDLIYLDLLDAALAHAGRTTLDPRWAKVPVGGGGEPRDLR